MTKSCHLTAKDFAYLESLVLSRNYGEPYTELLRQKLEGATVVLDHGIDRRVATIDSRVLFNVGGGHAEERVLTRDEKTETIQPTLPVTTLRGLALLGLKEDEVFPLRKQNGIIEPIRLMKVVHQPQWANRAQPTSAVVDFQPRWKKSLGQTGAPSNPLNDDPGPGAA